MPDAGFRAKKGGVDLNGKMEFRAKSGGNSPGANHEHWQDAVRATDGFSALEYVCPHRRAIWRRPLREIAGLHRAVSVYVLVAIVKKRLNLNASLYTLLQIFSLTLFEKMPVQQAFAGNDYTSEQGGISNQMNLFEF